MSKELENLKLENAKLKEELRYLQEKSCMNYNEKQMRMVAEIRDIVRRMEYQKELKEINEECKKLENQKEKVEWEIKCCAERKAGLEHAYYSKE